MLQRSAAGDRVLCLCRGLCSRLCFTISIVAAALRTTTSEIRRPHVSSSDSQNKQRLPCDYGVNRLDFIVRLLDGYCEVGCNFV